MGLFRRSDDEGLYQGDPQSIYVPGSGRAPSDTPARPAPPLFDDPLRTAAGAGPDRPPAPPGTFAAPPPRAPGEPLQVARRAVLILVAAGTVGGAVYGVSRVRQWAGTVDPDEPEFGDTPTRAPGTTRRTTTNRATTRPAGPTRSSSPSTVAPVAGRLGQAAVIAHGGNRYRVTVSNPRRQAGPIWDRSTRPKRGFLILDLSITRIDRAGAVRQISWSDWTMRVGAQTADGELIGGGWVADGVTTLRLAPGKSAAGTLVFDVPAGAGALSLGTSAGPASAHWSIPAVKTVVAPAAAAVGATVRSDVGGVPFTARLTKVTWFAADDPTVADAMVNGGLLMLDLALAWSSTSIWAKLHPTNGVWVRSSQWRFTPRTGRAQALTGTAADGRAIGRDVAVLPERPNATGLIAFDAAPGPGILSLLDDGGLTVMSWRVPGP